MRQGPNGRRGRGRPHPGSANGGQGSQGGGQGGGQSSGTGANTSSGNSGPRRSAASLRSQSFDSNGPDVRVRGNAWQVHEKYQTMARDAAASGDRVAAENYLQHAEHYHRIIEAINEATAAEQQQQTRNYTPQPEARGYYQQPTAQPGDSQADMRGNMAFVPTDAQPAVMEQSGMTPLASQEQQPTNPFFTPAEVEEAEQENLQITPAAVAMR